jgi:hypothetical protein
MWPQTNNFICKKHTLESVLFHKVYQWHKKYELLYSPVKGCFQDLASLIRRPESWVCAEMSEIHVWSSGNYLSEFCSKISAMSPDRGEPIATPLVGL